MFERDDDGAFRGLDRYLPNALVTFNTHDLSTYAGWRSFGDLKTEALARHRSRRNRRCALACAGDARRGAAPSCHRPQRSLFGRGFPGANTRSRLLAISLEDLLGVIDQPNIPGTVERASELAATPAGRGRGYRRDIDVAALKDATQERTREPRAERRHVRWSRQCRQDRRLWPDRRLRDRGAGRPRRLDRLAVLAGLQFRCLLCRDPRHPQERPLADRARRTTSTQISRRYWDNTLILETRFETDDGIVALIDFMPPRGKASDVVRLVRGVEGRVKMRMELVIRFGFGADIPWVKRTEDARAAGDLRAGHDGAAHAGRDPRRGHDDGRRVRGRARARRFRSCSPTARRICRCPTPIDPAQALAGHRGFLDRMVQPLHLRGRSSATW